MGRLSPSMTDSTLPVDAPNGTAAGRLDLGSPSGKVRAFHGVLALPKLRAGNIAGPSSNGRTPDFGSGNGGSSPPGPMQSVQTRRSFQRPCRNSTTLTSASDVAGPQLREGEDS